MAAHPIAVFIDARINALVQHGSGMSIAIPAGEPERFDDVPPDAPVAIWAACDAYRALQSAHQPHPDAPDKCSCLPDYDDPYNALPYPCRTTRALASVWSWHADYRADDPDWALDR